MIKKEIQEYYGRGQETERLMKGIGQLERSRTQELIKRYIPDPPAHILDVGGGPGFYAAWLARIGYDVRLIDPVALHIDQAQSSSADQPHTPIASFHIGDARELDFADNSADVVLLLGPLYHLTERRDRLKAIGEARRVLRPGGLLLATVITCYASTFVGLIRGWFFDPDYQEMIYKELDEGQHRTPQDWPSLFTTAYFHHPDEVQPEIEAAGFSFLDLLAIEGPGWLADDFDSQWADPARQEAVLILARRLERDIAGYSLSPHLMAAARKTDGD